MRTLFLSQTSAINEMPAELTNSVYFACTLKPGKEYGFTNNFSNIGDSPGILASKRK